MDPLDEMKSAELLERARRDPFGFLMHVHDHVWSDRSWLPSERISISHEICGLAYQVMPVRLRPK
jgi:hypothetical protein